jgi:hypothetical protein
VTLRAIPPSARPNRSASSARGAAAPPAQAEHDQDDTDDRYDQPDVEPQAVTCHRTSRDQIRSLAGKHCTNNQSDHTDDHKDYAPDTAIHSLNLPSTGSVQRPVHVSILRLDVVIGLLNYLFKHGEFYIAQPLDVNTNPAGRVLAQTSE